MTVLLILTAASFLTAMVSGFVGMAGGVTLFAAMTLFLPFQTIVPVHGVVQLISNSSRTLILLKHVHKRFTAYFVFGVPVGAFAAYLLLSKVERPEWVLLLIAATLLYVVFKPNSFPATDGTLVPQDKFFYHRIS